MNKNKIRNFSIIAHIDHGKSTLSDRLIEKTLVKNDNSKRLERVLDTMDSEKERGITIKLNYIRINYKDYIFNLVDTPGHVDFTYEVSRSLASCEGCLLIIDATQGIEAQTISNTLLALENDLEIIPVINKIDMKNADVEAVSKEIEDLLGYKKEKIIKVSAKTGENIEELMDAIIKYIPPPQLPTSIKEKNILKALIFDSYFDPYQGIVCFIKIKSGQMKVGDEIYLIESNIKTKVIEIGYKEMNYVKKDSISAGDIGYIITGIKKISDFRVGDTITLLKDKGEVKSLTGYKKSEPMIFCGIFAIDANDYTLLSEAIEKISLSDSSLIYTKENSDMLGHGYRVGLLGLLHLEIIQDRISNEFNVDTVTTIPSVNYRIKLTNGDVIWVKNPSKFPDQGKIKLIEEPYVLLAILTPNEYVGSLITLCENKRGIYKNLEIIDSIHKRITFEVPLSEVIFNFFDQLKSISKGYATMNYNFSRLIKSDLRKMNILLNGEIIESLSTITPRVSAYERGKAYCKKLKKLIPKHNFEVPIQASLGSTIIARETVRALRKDVIAKCYGGDITRKKKLLQSQKKGKKKMKSFGKVSVPTSIFIDALRD